MKNKVRTGFQAGVLGLLLFVAIRPVFDKSYTADFEQYCPFGGLSSFFSKINIDAMACSMNETQVMLGFALILGAAFIGKLFCSYLCPVGTVTEWIGALGARLGLQREIHATADRLMRSLKYILLFVTVYFTMTSSELFCKKYDPFFATVTLFGNPDIAVYFAGAALALTLGGALVYKFFWCKYLCPLGAFTNIFLNTAPAGGAILLYVAARLFGLQITPYWLLGALVLIGWVTEAGFMKSFLMPIPRITRSEQTCSDCGHCDDHCPQGIRISSMVEVRHSDCTLCSDCINTCPLKNTLTINHKQSYKYLAPVSVVLLTGGALIAASVMEFTTISLRWGKTPATQAVLVQSGMKSIKCYGSSMALAGTIENVEGILGIDTYVKSHSVKIYYDSTLISRKGVKALLFTPSKIEIRDVKLGADEPVGVFDIGVLGLFDAVDFADLAALLGDNGGILGFETRFGEPVRTTVYYVPSKISSAGIRDLLNRKYLMRNGEKIPINFETADQGETRETIRFAHYQSLIFDGYNDTFNTYDEYESAKLSVYTFPMPEAGDPALRKYFDVLAAHLSKDAGVVRFSTGFNGAVVGSVYFDASQTHEAAIRSALAMKQLTYFISDTVTEQIPNPFHIGAQAAIGAR